MHISNLMIEGRKICGEKEIIKEMVSFFDSLMTANPNIDPHNQDGILSVIPSLVSRDQNKMLGSIYNDKEIY